MATSVFFSACLAGTLFYMNWFSTAIADDSAQDIKVASMEIPYVYQEKGSGVYNHVLNRLIDGYGGTVQTIFYPSARYNKVMIGRAADCDYIATDALDRWQEHGVKPSELEFIGPINTLSVVVYIPADAADVTTVAEIQKLSIASDVNLLQTIHQHGIQEVFALQDQRQMLKLVAIKRIQGLIGYDFDLNFLSHHMGLRKKLKKASVILDTVDDGIVCFKNENTAAFRTHLRSRLDEISDSGWLDELFSRYRRGLTDTSRNKQLP